MAFGRGKRQDDSAKRTEESVADEVMERDVRRDVEKDVEQEEVDAGPDGPFDIEEFDNPEDAMVARLDLGSILIPMPTAGQIQVEVNQAGAPSVVWVVTPNGRFTIAAYAAPKSPGLWREVAAELADSLRKDNAKVSIEDGEWGREVVGVGQGVVRFIGIDGYRWMIRCVMNGAPQTIDKLVNEARNALLDTVVRRGDTPMPVRTPLPVQLPEEMANQLREAAARQAQQIMAAAQQAMLRQQQQPLPPQPQPAPVQQPGTDGSAMQQVRETSSGG